MKFGLRMPSISKRIAANISPKRLIRHSFGIKAPKSLGWKTNPKKFIYNKLYNKTTTGCLVFLFLFIGLPIAVILNIKYHII